MRWIFVYNADAGRLNAALDSLHKVLSPQTYDCRLCELTHGLASRKQEWDEALASFDVEIEFLHRDEFRERFERDDPLPAVFVGDDEGLLPLIESKELRRMPDLDTLIARLVREGKHRSVPRPGARGSSLPTRK